MLLLCITFKNKNFKVLQMVFIAVFNWVSKLFCNCFGFCDWLKKSQPLFYPIRSQPKTNHDLLACVFLHLAAIKCFCFEVLLIHWIANLCCDWLEWLLWFRVYDTCMKTALLQTSRFSSPLFNITEIGCFCYKLSDCLRKLTKNP